VSPARDFDDLLARHLDRPLDAAGRAALAAHLRRDPAHRRDYLRLLEQEELLVAGARELLTPSARIDAARLPRRVRRLPRRGGAGRPWLAWTAAALVLVAVGAVALRPETETAPPFHARVSGEVTVLRSAASLAGSAASPLRHGDVLLARTSADLAFPDGGTVTLGPGARLGLRADASDRDGVAVSLEAGSIACDLPTQPHGFTVATAQVRIAVVGTRFRVEATAGDSRIAVDEGRVRLRSSATEALLSAGELARITATAITRAAMDAPARLDDPVRWLTDGALAAEPRAGGATLAAAPGGPGPRDQWRGRAWRWYTPLPADAAIAIQARFALPQPDDGIWHGEVFLAPPEAERDAEEAQPSPCLRLSVRAGIPTVAHRTTPDAEAQVSWIGEQLPAGTRMLRLELRDRTVVALIDGRAVWRGPVPFETVVPGLRWTRRAAGTAPMRIDQVALEPLLPP
jgi:ferric-dicitrate binding protein FerR (iron transport regulator)